MNSFDRIAEALEQIQAKYLAFDPLLFVIPFFSALLGALFSWIVVHLQTKRQRKLENTQSLIDQFFSKDFIAHRVSLSKT